MRSRRPRAPACLLLALLCCLTAAVSAAEVPPSITIIVDDMGYRLRDGRRAMSLPTPIVYSVLPHTPHAATLARAAQARGSEVLLHLPMEAGSRNHLLGPGAITLAMDKDTTVSTLRENLAAVPGAIGVNNHMGSLLTRHDQPMRWLMRALAGENLLFVDSRTTSASVAASIAVSESLPRLSRDVFLDNVQEAGYVRAQFEELVAVARRRGSAIGIAHPHPVTIEVLARELQRLPERNLRLIGLRQLVQERAAAAARPVVRAARQ